MSSYDVYISYADKDTNWVEAELLPRLAAGGISVIQRDDFAPNKSVVDEMQRAVMESAYTLMVMTPDWLDDQYKQFDEVMTAEYGLMTNTWRALPLKIKPVSPPLRLQMLVGIDIAKDGERGWQKLIRFLEQQRDAKPDSAPTPSVSASEPEPAPAAPTTLPDYEDFELLLTSDSRAQAKSLQGDCWADLDAGLIDEIERLAGEVVQEREDVALLKELGDLLYQYLLPGQISNLYSATKAVAGANDKRIRIRLTVDVPALAAWPWELLYDADRDDFLGRNVRSVLARYVPNVAEPIKSLRRNMQRPLRLLFASAVPAGENELDVADEEARILKELKERIDAGEIEVTTVRNATVKRLLDALGEHEYHIFHFSGHGSFEDGAGAIALEDGDGRARWLPESEFANLFLNHESMGLVVLNACKGAALSDVDAMVGVAPRLVQRGIPAVVAMQYLIEDETARIFAGDFYDRLAKGWPVDAAMQDVRNRIALQVGAGRRDFCTPVLFMRAKDGKVL